MTIMFYQVTIWKDIKDNDASKKDTQTIMGFCAKENFGVTSLKLVPDQTQQYVEQPQPEVIEDYEPQEGDPQ